MLRMLLLAIRHIKSQDVARAKKKAASKKSATTTAEKFRAHRFKKK